MTGPLHRGDGWDAAHRLPASFGSGPANRAGVPVGSSHFQPLPAARRRRAPGLGGFLLVLALVLTVTLAGLQQWFPLSAAEPTASGTGRGRPTAGPQPSGTPTTGDPLTDNPLYDLSPTGRCPSVEEPKTRSEYTEQVADLLTCLAVIYRPLVESAGGEFTEVEHVFYDEHVDSSCGTQTDAYAFYCEGDQTIYLSDQVYRDRIYGRLVVADVVIHEYSHHVQGMVGILDASRGLSESDAVITRRIELQVFCMTYYLFVSVPSFALTVDDHSYFREVWGSTDDPVGHGSVKAQKYWGAQGLAASELGACNTWSVPADRVR